MKKNRIKKVVFAMGTCWMVSICSFITYASEIETDLKTDVDTDIAPQEPEEISLIITHQHTGSSGSGGGCYGQRHTSQETQYCRKSLSQVNWSTLVCSSGHTWTNTVSGGWDSWPKPSNCDEVIGTTTRTYYSANCGRTGEVLGNLYLKRPSTEWAKEVTLSAHYEVADGIELLENPVIFKGNDREEETEEFVVTENGTYTCGLQIDGPDSNASNQVITYEVKNIDCMAPTISSITYDQSLFIGETEITVEAKDLQEDGSEGIGLTETPYSYDGGKTWIAENTFMIQKNGIYTVMVKDLFDQVATKEVEITTLDTMGPTVSTILQENLDTEYKSVKVIVYVEDLQEDGSKGAGLGEKPYSFDGGKTWQEQEYYYYHGNGNYSIIIRDAKGNETKASVSIRQFPEPHKPNTPISTPTPVIPPIVEEEEILEEPIEEPIEEVIVTVKKKQIVEEEEEIPKLGIIEPDRTETVVVRYKQPKQYEAPEEIEVEELDASQQELENEALIHEKRMEEVKKIVVISTAAVASVSVICALLYCFLFMTVVFGKTNQNGKRFLGIAKVKRGEKMEIHIPNRVYERNTTHIMMVYMNPFVAHKYALEPVIIYVNNSEYLYSIEPVIYVEVTLM